MRNDAFRPSRHGFRFPNEFREAPGCGLGAPLLPGFGMSGGIAWAALDRFLAGRPVPALSEPPAATDPLYGQLCMRQANALAAARWERLVEWQCLPERALPGQQSLATLSRAHWRRAQKSIDGGVPMLLFLVVASGRHANPSGNLAVLAVGYDVDREARRITVQLYDPCRPGDDNVRLTFRTGRFDPLEARFAAETRIRGFFSVPYDRPLPPPLVLDGTALGGTRRVDEVIAVLGSERPDGALEILARDATGLLHLRRDRKGEWTAADPEQGSDLRAAPTVASLLAGRGRIVARARTGELIELRRSRLSGWRTRTIEGGGRSEDGAPAALDGKDGLTVAACRGGSLVVYRYRTVRGWTAEPVVADLLDRAKLAGTPAIAWLGDLHVLCRTEAGDLIHARRQAKEGWTATSATARPGGRTRFTLADDPIILRDADGGCINVVARGTDGAVVHFRWTEDRGWRGTDLTMTVRVAGGSVSAAHSKLSAVLDDDGTVHVAAGDPDGGLIHLWCTRGGEAGGGEITRTRPGSAVDGRIDGAPLLGTGRGGGLQLFARQGTDLLLFRWTPVGDWTVENVSRERRGAGALDVAAGPVLVQADHATHVVFGDAAGSAHHVFVAAGARRATGARTVAAPTVAKQKKGRAAASAPAPAATSPTVPAPSASEPPVPLPDRKPAERPEPRAAPPLADSPPAISTAFPDEEPRFSMPEVPILLAEASDEAAPSAVGPGETPARDQPEESGAPAPLTLRLPDAGPATAMLRLPDAAPATAMPQLPDREPPQTRLIDVPPRGRNASSGKVPAAGNPFAREADRPNGSTPSAPRHTPSVDGLPLLLEGEDQAAASTAPSAPPPAAPTAPVRKVDSKEQNRRELARIMTLADEDRPELVNPG